MWCLVDKSNNVIVWAAFDQPKIGDGVEYVGIRFPSYNLTNSEAVWLNIPEYAHGKFKYVAGEVVLNPDFIE